MKILSANQIRDLDAFTIKNEPIASIDLMERASLTFVNWFTETFTAEDQPVVIFCGPGNNGGDGLAIARLLYYKFYAVTVFQCVIGSSVSEDFRINLDRLPGRNAVPVTKIEKGNPFPELPKNGIIIDAIFGSGLNRPVDGYWGELLEFINQQEAQIISVDIPSGLFADQFSRGNRILADYTFSFELPKLAFLFPQNALSLGNWVHQSIGLNQDFIENAKTPYHYIDQALAGSILKRRDKFGHKGTFGHALLMAGSFGKIGAAVLAAKAALRSGAGLLTIHAPVCAYDILQISVPEAMVSVDEENAVIATLPDLGKYDAIGFGPGIDTKKPTVAAFKQLLQKCSQPLVIDADGLNLLAANKDLLALLPKNSILTPHPGEFKRLFGGTTNDFEKNELQRNQAKKLGVYIVLKGAHTCIADPQGNCFFNSTGNPGMATGGSGDVLTGILTGLLAQGYTPKDAAILAVFLHGLAGDLAVQDQQSQESLVAGDIIQYLGKAFQFLYGI